MSKSDPWESASMRAWVARCREELIPKLLNSEAVLTLAPRGKTDIKFAVELGLSIMFDKPIIVIHHPDSPVPSRLRRVADRVVAADVASDDGKAIIQQVITEFLAARS